MVHRRDLVKGVAAGWGGGALLESAGCSKPSAALESQNKQPVAPAVIKWKVQSHDPKVTSNYDPFVKFCQHVGELSQGQLMMEPHGPDDIVPVSGMFEGVKAGKLDLIRIFPGFAFIPGASFLTSYPLGLDRPDQWETWYYGFGGLELARRMFEPHGLYFVGPIQHDLNLIHSRTPIRSFADFKGIKLRMPGGLIADVFEAAGSKTVLLSGDQVYPALKGASIDAADFGGPSTNFNLGFAGAAKYIIMGPPSTPCIHQPVDLHCVLVNRQSWDALPKYVQQVLEYATRRFSWDQNAYVQKEDAAAWGKFREAGVETIRLSNADVDKFRRIAIPLWFKWAQKDPIAREAFASQLEYMRNPAVGYVTDDMLVDAKGNRLTL